MTRLFFFVVGVLLAASPGYAQLEECGTYRDTIEALVTGRDFGGNPVDAKLQAERLSSVQNNMFCFALFVAEPSGADAILFQQFVRRLEGFRTDKETSSGGGAGATSVVAQGPAARVLSAAVEHGALTRAVEGQVITLRGNLAGVPAALVRKNVFPYCPAGVRVSEFCVEHSLLSWLRRTAVSVSFDASRDTEATGTAEPTGSAEGAQPVTFEAKRNQISAASARIELWNRRDVTSKAFQDSWRAKVAGAMAKPSAELSRAAGDLADAILALDEYKTWQPQTAAAIAEAGTDRARIVATLRNSLDYLVAIARTRSPNLDRLAGEALTAYSRFFLAQDELIGSLATKNVVALEYTFNRPTGQVATDNVRAIFDMPLTQKTKLVANAAVTFYQDLPAGSPPDMSRYRDAQLGVQVERGIGSQSIVGPALFVVALYYQYQHAPSLFEIDPANPIPGITFTGLPQTAKTVFTNTGNIILGQVKLAVTPSGSSVKIPLSLTISNKTELVDKPTWRAQVGLAYDFDALLGAFTAAR